MIYEKEKKIAQARAKVMKALAHPTRIFIVELLTHESLSVKELTEAVGADVSTVSKHLSLLKQSGILLDQKDGNRVLYSLICPCIMEFIHCIDDIIYQDVESGLSCVFPDATIVFKGE